MKSITNSAELKMAIQQLEQQQAHDLIVLKEKLEIVLEDLKPINLIKNTFKEAVAGPDLKSDVINAVIGLTTGIVAKKLMIGKTINPFKKILGIIVEMAVAKKVANNAEDIKSTGSMLLNAFFKKKETPVEP